MEKKQGRVNSEDHLIRRLKLGPTMTKFRDLRFRSQTSLHFKHQVVHRSTNTMAPSRAIFALPLRSSSHAHSRAHLILHLSLLSNSCRTMCSQHTPITHPFQIHRSLCPSLQLKQTRCFPSLSLSRRSYSSAAPDPPDHLNEHELHVFNKIRNSLEPVQLEVQDISGGCGSMYAVEVTSPKFNGLSVIKQHKMVNEVLKEEIAGWHGLQLKTRAI